MTRPETSGINWLSVEGIAVPWECTFKRTPWNVASVTLTLTGVGLMVLGSSTGAVAISVAAPNRKTTTIAKGMIRVRIMVSRPPGRACFGLGRMLRPWLPD